MANEDEVVEAEPTAAVSLEDAARRVCSLVEQHRTVGDSDLQSALDDVKAALPPVAEEA